MARSTVYGVLRRHGLSRLAHSDRASGVVVRYERERPGELVHLDVKKLGRIPVVRFTRLTHAAHPRSGGPAVRAAFGGNHNLAWLPRRVVRHAQARGCPPSASRCGQGTRPGRRCRPGVTATAPERAVLGPGRSLADRTARAAVANSRNPRTPERRPAGSHCTPQPWPPPAPGRRRRGRAHRPHRGHRRVVAANPDGGCRPDGDPGSSDDSAWRQPQPRPHPQPRRQRQYPGAWVPAGQRRLHPRGDPTPAGRDRTLGIAPTGINDRRQIVGEYVDDRLISRGFLIDQDGRYTRIDVPGSLATNAAKINNRGKIVGVYSDTSRDLGDRPDSDPTAPTYKLRGFLLDKHGRFTRLDFPGSRSSQAFGINDRGQVVGEYKDSAGKFHGYVWERGRFATIDVPGATATSAFGINNRGQILFRYGDDRSPFRGAVLSKGVFTRFDAPSVPAIFPFGLNDRGQIVGVSGDPADPTTARGFLLAKGAMGPFTTISRPGAPVTVPTDINDRGQIVGLAEIPDAPQGPQPTDTLPMSGMA